MQIDHLAVLCTCLEDGVAHVEGALGVDLSPGGQHPAFGTHNRLLSLGPDTYLEVIAVNPDAPAPARARWFGLDTFDGPPRLARWIARSDALDAAVAALGVDRVGVPLALARAEYRWRMCVREDGAQTFDGLFPALMQWDGAHPAPALPDRGLRLRELRLSHPRAAAMRDDLAPLMADARLTIADGAPGIVALLDTPNGTVTLA